jgi:hypothetical protein
MCRGSFADIDHLSHADPRILCRHGSRRGIAVGAVIGVARVRRAHGGRARAEVGTAQSAESAVGIQEGDELLHRGPQGGAVTEQSHLILGYGRQRGRLPLR